MKIKDVLRTFAGTALILSAALGITYPFWELVINTSPALLIFVLSPVIIFCFVLFASVFWDSLHGRGL